MAIRVLVVDDSVVVRGGIVRMFSDVPEIEVAGTARDGAVALAKLEQGLPDVLLLDVEMPTMDGLELLEALRERGVSLPVLVFSSLTTRGGFVTIEALSRGASDYVLKPSATGGPDLGEVKALLVDKIVALAGRRGRARPPSPTPPAPIEVPRSGVPAVCLPDGPQAVDVVAIAASTGGPGALNAILPQLPSTFPVPIVLAQHMPPVFTAQLARSLDLRCALEVVEGVAGMPLSPGRVYVAPGDHHMVVRRAGVGTPHVELNRGAPIQSCRPAADALFRSVAEVYGMGALGLVLTGMGRDGLDGSRAIVGRGGRVLAQDEASAVVWSMPRHVVEAGLVTEVCALEDLAGALFGRVVGRAQVAHG